MSSVLTPTGVMSFPNLFVPKPPAPGAEARFGLNLLFTAEAQKTKEYTNLRKLVAECLDERFGAGKSADRAWLTKNKIKFPFRPCSDREYTGYDIPNGVFIAPWSKNKPGLIDAGKQDILVPSDIWSGQHARCTVHAFAYDTSGNKGVGFMLNNVQIVLADAPRLDGRKAAADEFEAVDHEAGDNGPMDDDPPF